MKVYEKLTNVNLFDEIDKLHPLPFRDIFTPEQLNIFYINAYGERTLSKIGRNLEVSEIAKIIVPLYSDKWDKIYNEVLVDFPVLNNHTETIEETIDENGTNTNDTTETRTDKVSAYNIDDFVNDNEAQNSVSTTIDNTNKVTKSTTKTISDNPVENMRKALEFLQNEVIYFMFFADVNNTITLNIFN